MKIHLLACTIFLLAVGIALSQNKSDPILDKIDSAFTEAFNSKDATRVASFYAEDAVLMPPDQPLVHGRANIETYYKSEFIRGIGRLQLQPLEATINGTLVEVPTDGSSKTIRSRTDSADSRGRQIGRSQLGRPPRL